MEPFFPLQMTEARRRRYLREAVAYFKQARACEDDRERAIYLYKAAWQKSGETMTEAANNAGCLRFELGDYKSARAFFWGAIKADEDNPVAWFNLGVLCQVEGYEQAAQNCFRRAKKCPAYKEYAAMYQELR